ncbi:putative disulphide isomerase [Organic Lake phycodnavirus]|jgi:thiol-disulfide isomerase/thioredoxin|nr:putative disulphide isomerase [Organic Lake phycodnavirus]
MKALKKMTNQLKKMDLQFTLILVAVLVVLYFIYTTFKLDEAFEASSADFASKLKSDDKQLVMFYADWCGHCKKIKPQWDEASTEIGNEKMIKVNVGEGTPEQKELMEQYDVNGFPTILIFENGQSKGPFPSRDKSSFLEFFA